MRDERRPDGALWAVVALGIWELFTPLMMEYPRRELLWSDLGSGAALIVLALLAMRLEMLLIRWALALVGLWLTAAPLIFWAPDAASYLNHTVIGTLVIIASVILPYLSDRDAGARTPPGWSYNPSEWSQRIPILGLAFTGFLLARYLSAFQLGHIPSVWEPFFGRGTETILTSDVSRAFPVSDAGLGAWSYLLDALSGSLGGTRRWRTMPWAVVLFGIMIIPPGVTSITLVILQPVAVGAWCTVCLITAVIMLLMVPPAIDEVVATLQALRRARREGHSLRRVFWAGIPEIEGEAEVVFISPRKKKWTVPLGQVVTTLLGTWLMASPAIFGAQGLASHSNHFAGALVVTFAVIASAQVARPARFLNMALGVALAAAIWFLPGGSTVYKVNSLVAGLLVAIASYPLGPITQRFGSYDRVLRKAA